ncbi:MAG: DUF1501 domain-containing protein [Myxococcales bacterium]|nr:DUF1501 domain-containing protein [Myxococcales bacterium]
MLHDKRITRRGFLGGALTVGGGLAALGGLGPLQRLAHAQAQNPDAPDRYYVFCYFGGGWDVLLSLDPRDPRDFPSDDESLARTHIQPAYDQLQRPDADIVRVSEDLAFGPFMGDLLRHTDKLAVVRGINMETLAHEGGRRRFLTGKPPSGVQARGSSASTWLAGHLGRDALIPNLSLRLESYNKDMPNYATALRVNSIPDLLRALRPSDPILPERLRAQIGLSLSDAAACPPAKRSPSWQVAEFARVKGRDMVAGDVGGLFDFGARTPEMDALRDRYGFARVDNSPAVSAAFAAQAITGGISRCVSVALTGGLDTHDQNWANAQGPNQERGFNAIARLVDDLSSRDYGDGSSWLDHTVIVGFSEFSRTPMLNPRGGRDHHLTNSALVLGGNIRGGQVIGASSDVAMQSVAVDLHTGRPSPEGEIIKPEHILRTLFDEVGIDQTPDLRVTGIPALMRA